MSGEAAPRQGITRRTYRLWTRPTATPIPVGIVEVVDGKEVRIVAMMDGQARATMEEALAMLAALNGLKHD